MPRTAAAQARVRKSPAPGASRPRVYGSSVGLTCRNTEEVIRVLKQGLPISAFEHLHTEIGISSRALALTTHIPIRTLTRRKQEGRLATDESERLYRLGVLYDRTVEVLGDPAAARQWFTTAKEALRGQSPLLYADTEPGAREVEDLLGRLEHGVFS